LFAIEDRAKRRFEADFREEFVMQGKIVVATGATSGIGEVAVMKLAAMGARIVFVARETKRAEATLAKLERIAPGRGHRAHLADLSLIAETRRVGSEIAASEPRVDALVNNAGAVFSRRRVTAEGLELTFALNHMAYFVLTQTLRDRLAASAPARVVSTASAAHAGARLDFDDLQCAGGFSGWKAYGRSKLCNILFTRELARRLAGTRVTANCLHPGFVASRFGKESGGWIAPLISLAQRFAISPEAGADTLVYLVSSPEVASVSGEYFAKRKIRKPSAAARDDSAARMLWDKSEEIAG
jgi:NAD(P)-dependent dehydrogenase (short-subunit alcohol dehydrogenase family)